MKKSIVILAAAAVFSLGITVYGWLFIENQIGEATLTEKTVTGNIEAADGLDISFKADSQDNMYWINSFDYSSGKSKSSFRRGKLSSEEEGSVYDDIRFAGWSDTPYFICLDYDLLNGLQNKKIHSLYEEAALRVVESGKEEKGRIRVKDYLDFYPVSLSFAFENKMINSDNALIGLKVYDEKGKLSPETAADYDEDVYLYSVFNDVFKIPVIDNEYHEYKVLKDENYDNRTELPYKVEIEKASGDGEDFYEFDPILVFQEEDIKDGREWIHPDTAKTLNSGDGKDGSGTGHILKNRILFAVNNRTAKGEVADVSQKRDGYGIYELPVDMSTTRIKYIGRRPVSVPNPCPLPDMLKMVYPLDTEAEYIEMSLSYDHRYLAVFFIKEGTCFVETVVLLSHKKADSYIHIDVEFGEGEGKIPVDSIAKRAEAYKPKEKVTYKMIKEYIEAKYGFKVHTAYIAEVKRDLGLPMYDAPNAVEELKQPRKHPTPEKVEAIKDALRYFAVI